MRRGSELKAEDKRRQALQRTRPKPKPGQQWRGGNGFHARKPKAVVSSAGGTWWVGLDRAAFYAQLEEAEAQRMRLTEKSTAVYAPDSAWTGRREQAREFAPGPKEKT